MQKLHALAIKYKKQTEIKSEGWFGFSERYPWRCFLLIPYAYHIAAKKKNKGLIRRKPGCFACLYTLSRDWAVRAVVSLVEVKKELQTTCTGTFSRRIFRGEGGVGSNLNYFKLAALTDIKVSLPRKNYTKNSYWRCQQWCQLHLCYSVWLMV